MEIIAYIKEHLAARGLEIKVIRCQRLVFEENKLKYDINAYNQFVFLKFDDLQTDTRIIADNNACIKDSSWSYDATKIIEEFTGLISIESNYSLYGTHLNFIQITVK